METCTAVTSLTPFEKAVIGFCDRLSQVREALGFTTDESFARFLGVTPQAINNWRFTRASIGAESRLSFEQKTGFDCDWVNKGDGNEKARHVLDAEIDIEAALKSVALRNWLSKKLFAPPVSPLGHQFVKKGRADRLLDAQALALLAAAEIQDSQDPEQAPKILAARLLQQRALDLLKEVQGLLRNSGAYAQCPSCSSPTPHSRQDQMA